MSERIIEQIKNQGITQRELAERVGITEATLCRYIAGDREPKADILANLRSRTRNRNPVWIVRFNRVNYGLTDKWSWEVDKIAWWRCK